LLVKLEVGIPYCYRAFGEADSALTTVADHDFGLGLATSGSTRLDLLHQIHVGRDFSEYDVLSIQPRSYHRADEELRTVRVWASIGHRENSRLGVLEGKVFISELLSVDRFSTGSVATSKVAALNHELGNDTVKLTALEAKALLSGAESSKIFSRLGNDVGEERELDAPFGLAADGNVEEHLGVGHFVSG